MSVISRLEAWIARYGLGTFAAVLLLLDVVVLLGVLPWSVPKNSKLVLATVTASSLLGWAPAERIVRWLWQPNEVLLLVVNMEDDILEMWSMTPDYFGELSINEGRLYQWQASRPVYECLSYDEEEHSARATWRATATDLQLLENEEKVTDIHGELGARAEWGTALRMRFLPFVRAATAQQAEAFTEAFETATLPDGDAIKKVVADAKPERLSDDRGLSKELDESRVLDVDEDDAPGGHQDTAEDGPVKAPETGAEGVADD